MYELKPCPFCGGEVNFNVNAMIEPNGVRCMKCRYINIFLGTELQDNERIEACMQRIADKWNRRTEDDKQKVL